MSLHKIFLTGLLLLVGVSCSKDPLLDAIKQTTSSTRLVEGKYIIERVDYLEDSYLSKFTVRHISQDSIVYDCYSIPDKHDRGDTVGLLQEKWGTNPIMMVRQQ